MKKSITTKTAAFFKKSGQAIANIIISIRRRLLSNISSDGIYGD